MKIKVYYVEVAPELESREFDLGSIFKLKNECTIGRSPESDLVLDSPDLSRSHGRIISKNGNYYFIDLGSRNGSLFNDRLTTPAQEYLLNRDDTIRIGDFVLKIEEEEEQAATVFKVIDPALFKSKQPAVEDIPTPEALVLPILPVVELAQNAALTPPPIDELDDRVPVIPVIEPHPPTALVVDRFDERSTFVQLSENHPPALVTDELDDEIPVIEPHPPTALVVDRFDEHSTFVQLGENHPPALVTDELDDDVPVIEPHPPTALVVDRFDDRSTFIQLGEHHPPALIVDELDDELPVIEPHPPTALVVDRFDEHSTFVQLGENHPPALVTDELDGDDEVSIIKPQPPTALVVDRFDERSTFVQLSENHPPAVVTDELDDELPDIEPQPPTALIVDELDAELPVVEPQPATALVIDELDDELPVIESHPPTPLVVDELDEVDLEFEESSSLPIAAIAASVPIAAIVTHNVELDPPNKRFGAELLKQKQIVLIAHDEKIADLVELIDRNKDFLATCLTISWASISDSLQQETGMVISKKIAHGAAGGYQALAGLVNSGDVLAVIFLRDLFAQNQAGKANEEAMLRLCNINEILLGTNIATADAIVHYLQS